MKLFAEYDCKATFFVLGEVAEEFPDLIREIASSGHELGVHGYRHLKIYTLSPDEFRSEVGRAKKLIEDLTGQRVLGHRAPAFSFERGTTWPFDVLLEEGFIYDSSVHPASVSRYGWPGFSEDIHEMTLPSGQTIIEAPMSVVHILGKTLPACGGGYLRRLPFWYTRWAMKQINNIRPAIVYVHPYEIDTDRPDDEFMADIKAGGKEAMHFHKGQTHNRRTVIPKLTRLFQKKSFAPLKEVIAQQLGRAID